MSGETFPLYVLNRDGKEVKRGSEMELLDYMQEHEISDGVINPA